MEAEQLLASYQHRVGQIGRRAAAAQRALATVAESATSSDGAVTVTVSPSGALLELRIGARAEELSRVQLAAAILATAQRAQAASARRVAEVMGPLLGDGSAAVGYLRSQLAADSVAGRQR